MSTDVPDPDSRRLLDVHAITEVLYRYCRAVDRFDIPLLRTVYHPDAVDRHGVFDGGADAFIEFFAGVAGPGSEYVATHHAISNVLVDLDGDTAQVESYYTAAHRRESADGAYDELVRGRYLDRFERRDGQWRIADRVCVYDWSRIVPATSAWWDGVEGSFVRGTRDASDPLRRPVGVPR